MKRMTSVLAGAGLALAASLCAGEGPAASQTARIKHVLLISVDGLHAVDLSTYVATHAGGALANLARHGVTYPAALTSAPSDSFPGILAQVTGGSSRSHGVYYDVSYDRSFFAPGSGCKGDPGTQVTFDETIDRDTSAPTGGGTLGQPLTQIDAAKLPMRLVEGRCQPVYPHEAVRTNTIFEVIKAAGGRTAWADKHPAYDLLNGPSGKGVDDLFTPEVDSNDEVTKDDTTKGFHSIQRNDQRKVDAVLNEIAGRDSTGTSDVGVPAIMGMNFQAVSVAQKLAKGSANDPQDAGLVGGYADAAGRQPSNGLQANLDYVDAQLGRLVAALDQAGLTSTTLVIVSAKHGQSPIDRTLRQGIDDDPYSKTPGYGASSTDDIGLIWLKPQAQQESYEAARRYLDDHAALLGIVKILDRKAMTAQFQDPYTDPRAPDFITLTKPGLIYTGGSKLAEHGGFSPDDRAVALLVANPALAQSAVADPVETRQIAPTILRSLGLDPGKLEAVQMEHTAVLPGLDPLATP